MVVAIQMNQLDQPSMYRGNDATKTNWEVIGGDAPSLPAPVEETSPSNGEPDHHQ